MKTNYSSHQLRFLSKKTLIFIAAFILLGSSQNAVAQWATNGNNINNTNTGSVGIGVANPTSRLVVGGDGQQTELQGDLLMSRTGSYPYIYTNHPTIDL